MVLQQLLVFLNENSILEMFQTGFKVAHSTESALLKVFNDIFLALDKGDCVILVLLDLSAAFDMIDHEILISCLENLVGLKGMVLKWFRSFLSDRYFSVNYGDSISKKRLLPWGVPQGSILSPTLFSLYLLPLGNIFGKHGISFHCFANDTQLYLPLKHPTKSLDSLLACLNDIKNWMEKNFLMLNEEKTEVIVFGQPKDSIKSLLDSSPLTPYFKTSVRDLGFQIDDNLKMEKQINSVVRACFYNLRLLAKTKIFL